MLITTDAKGFLRHGAHTSLRLRRIGRPKQKAAFGTRYPDLQETCERCWGCTIVWYVIFYLYLYILFWYMLTGLYWWLGIFETWNQGNPCCWGLHRFFLLTAAHSTKNNQASILPFFQHIFSWNIFLRHLVSDRFVSGKVNKDVWGAPLLEPFGLLKHEKKRHSWRSKKLLQSKKDFYPISRLAGQ